MAIQSLTDLKALINSTIQDNTTNDISGSDVQTALINAIDTLDSLEGFINVHKANGQTTITAYGSKALARAAVPDDCKKEGVVIAYKISTGWLIEQNLDATAGTWGDDASWQTIGPVSVSQNTLTIGGVAQGELAGQLIDNPEWVKVVTDSNDKVLYGVKADGKFYFGDGCPPQVQEYVTNYIEEYGLEALMKSHFDYYNVSKHHSYKEYFNVYTVNDGWQKITYNSSLGEYDDLDIYQIGEQCNFGGDTANSYQATSQHRGVAPATITQDFIIRPVYTLNEALEAIPNDIKSSFFAGQVICFTNDNNEVETWELQADDSWSQKVPILIQNPEYIAIETDIDGKILSGRNTDGSKFENLPVEFKDKVSIDGNVIEKIEDSEGRIEIKTDSEQKILSYRDSEGVLHEEAGIETNHLGLSEKGMTEFQQALKDSGFNPGGAGNWSDYISNDGNNPLHIPEPRCIRLNFSGVNAFPSSKTADAHAVVEYLDMQGNYFKKNCLLNAHGQQTLMFPKKNITVDFLDADYESGDAFAISFGDWVAQDSFHLKAYYSDDIRGKGCVGYKIYKEFMKTRGVLDSYPYMKYIKSIMDDSDNDDIVDVNVTHSTGALCFPDGFPAIVYLNGEFWGVYAFQLKKNRKNYFLDSKTAENIHIEGMISYERFFNGTINWTGGSYGIEVKNPKNLYYQRSNNGKAQKYDFDGGHIVEGVDDQEIMGTDSEYYDMSSDKAKDFKRCAKSKQYIEAFARYIPELVAIKEGGATVTEIKEAVKARFDVDFMIDYLILQNLIGNHDSISNNCQWVTWNGVQWCPNPYDLNDSFKVWDSKLGDNLNYPFGWCWTYFLQEMKDRYQTLRSLKVIDTNNIISLVKDWMLKVGVENYELENEKWPASAMQGNVINTDFWKEIPYDASYPTYTIGDYPAGSKVNMNWEGEDRSFEALVNIQHSQYTDLVAYSNRMSLFDYKDVLDHNIANLDNWFNS